MVKKIEHKLIIFDDEFSQFEKDIKEGLHFEIIRKLKVENVYIVTLRTK